MRIGKNVANSQQVRIRQWFAGESSILIVQFTQATIMGAIQRRNPSVSASSSGHTKS